MVKSRQLSPELWPLFDVILFSYIELIFRGGVSCLPAALLFPWGILVVHVEYFCLLRMQLLAKLVSEKEN